MGGAISTFMAERDTAPFDGIYAIGAALLVEEPVNPMKFTYKPKRPLLYLTNTDEVHIIEEYVERCPEGNLKPSQFIGTLGLAAESAANETNRLAI